jgi:hypothetical protein
MWLCFSLDSSFWAGTNFNIFLLSPLLIPPLHILSMDGWTPGWMEGWMDYRWMNG